MGCAIFRWATGKEFAYVAGGLRLQEALRLVPLRCGEKASLLLSKPPTLRHQSRIKIGPDLAEEHEHLICLFMPCIIVA